MYKYKNLDVDAIGLKWNLQTFGLNVGPAFAAHVAHKWAVARRSGTADIGICENLV